VKTFVHSVALMDTVVTFRIPIDPAMPANYVGHVQRCVQWFRDVELICTRFVADSEVSRLGAGSGRPVKVSAVVFECMRFAVALAVETDGAFDPTIGATMERRGHNTEYRTGNAVSTTASTDATYRDIHIDEEQFTITVDRPMVIDLGAVAKGLAVDLAAQELSGLKNFLIDAGGDCFASGLNEEGRPWKIGVRHPTDAGAVIETLHVSNSAVCTSGNYDRRSPSGDGHIVDPRTGATAATLASATVMAPRAVVADGLATAAFVLGPVEGIRLLERQRVSGVLFSPQMERFATHDA
jgi:thiamine biosynthesis lipoprotein